MGIIARDQDPSSKRYIFETGSQAVATGVTGIIEMAPWPCSLDFATACAFGISNTPNVQLFVNRFIPGTGFTAFAVGSTLALPAYGTSGIVSAGISLPPIGSTLTTLLAGDVVLYQTGGTNSAATGFHVQIALRPIQDIQKLYGVL